MSTNERTAEPVISKATHPCIRLVGGEDSARAYEIRDFLTRSVVDFEWYPNATDAVADTVPATTSPSAITGPTVWFPDGAVLRDPSIADVAAHLGWVTAPTRHEYDLSIFGAGPAGLSAAVYGASEGLSVVIVESGAVGGQAGSSSLIENYLGFPHGVPGAELAERARQQASDFGAEFLQLRTSARRSFRDGRLHVTLSDGSAFTSRANICATGVAWRRLGLPREADFLDRGLYYGAGTGEAVRCTDRRVVVVGGANSAGQAAINLARYAEHVTMIVRGKALAATLSDYLIQRIRETTNITVSLESTITALIGDDRLTAIEVTPSGGEPANLGVDRVFVCIGGEPDTSWARGTPTIRDQSGYLVTGPDLLRTGRPAGWNLARDPYFLETSIPGSFAAGDVRHGAIKRVASAVGEGAMAVTLAHRYLSE